MADTEQRTASGDEFRPEGIGHVVLRVRDLERSTSFYEGLLGFTKVGEVPGRMAFFSPSRASSAPPLPMPPSARRLTSGIAASTCPTR